MAYTREEARQDINRRPLTEFVGLQRSKSGLYCCPICHSGEGPKKSGALSVDKATNRVRCFANDCFTDKGEDTLGALRTIWGCSELEALERAGYTIERSERKATATSSKPKREEQPKPQPEREPEQDFSADIVKWNAFLLEAEEAEPGRQYLASRNISMESAKKFMIGYAPDWTHPSGRSSHKSRRIIIPRSNRSYLARAIDPEEELQKQVAGNQKDLFNVAVLLQGKKRSQGFYPVIVEGEIDAITLDQMGVRDVVGLGSTSNYGQLVAAALKAAPEAVYILGMDNDESGTATQAKFAAKMAEKGLDFIDASPEKLYAGENDAADAADKKMEAFSAALFHYQTAAAELEKAKELERYKRTGPGMVDSFLEAVQSHKYEPIPTGMSSLDRALGGGFVRQTLVMLGAAPGVGKTAFAQQVFEGMAAEGSSIVFLNLEMSREQLLARSLSRISSDFAPYGAPPFKAYEILRGYQWSDTQREIIMEAAEEYKRSIAPNVLYNPDGVSPDLDNVLSLMDKEARAAEAEGRPAPFVVVDYLQMLQGREREDPKETIKRAVASLKSYAIEHNSIVFLITAFNRQSNSSGQVTLESGRDTSAIEYAADLMLGMNYTALEDETAKAKDLPELQRRNPREYTLKVLKNRMGQSGAEVKMRFDGERSRFTIVDENRSGTGYTQERINASDSFAEVESEEDPFAALL